MLKTDKKLPEPKAWLITGSKVFTDVAAISFQAADARRIGRGANDTSELVPLYDDVTLRASILSDLAAQAGDVEKSGLLPCPFCGESPTKSTYQDESLWNHNIVDWHVISCPDCEIDIRQCDGDDEITTRWNSRAISTPLLAQVEGLKAENSAVMQLATDNAKWCLEAQNRAEAAEQERNQLKGRVEELEKGKRFHRLHLIRKALRAKQLAVEYKAAYIECRSRVEELEGQIATLQTLVPHPGDGTCYVCGCSPAHDVPMCEGCCDAFARIDEMAEEALTHSEKEATAALEGRKGL